MPLLAACDLVKLHARVSGACTHTLSPLSRSSQFLFEETEALRSSGLVPRLTDLDSVLRSWVLTEACMVLSVFHIYYLAWRS